jgi:hypothetical protein
MSTATPSRLILLPDKPGGESGYQKGVRADVERLRPTPADLVVVFTTDPEPGVPGGVLLSRSTHLTLRRGLNVLRFRATAEPMVRELRPLVTGRHFDEIFCGETIFYRPLKKLFPGREMTVRFHNIFAMARYRQQFRRYRISRMLQYNLEVFFRLEREILSDPLVKPIFVTEDEVRYMLLAFPEMRWECWPNSLNIRPGQPRPMVAPSNHRLVYFGGLPSHTRPGVDYLVERVFPRLRERSPGIELALYGAGTERYHSPGSGVFGHGFYKGQGYPADGLYAVPDLLGVGIKIKVGDMIHDGVPFIVTPFGTDGYPGLGESEHLLIADMDSWPHRVAEYFQRLGLDRPQRPRDAALAMASGTTA